MRSFKQGADIDGSFKCEDVKELSVPFWLTCFSCMCTYIGIINSLIIGSSVLQTRFAFTEVEAGFYFTLPYLVAAILSPICGVIVEKYGKRMTINIWGSAIMVIAHIYQICLPDCDKCWISLGPLILLGISYTAYAVVLWGALPYMVEARVLGTAFGICTTF